jgi:hypothetical protein
MATSFKFYVLWEANIIITMTDKKEALAPEVEL